MPNQWRRNSSGKPSTIFATGRPLVLVVMIVPGLRIASILRSRLRLISRSSTTASMIQSTSASFCRSSSKLPMVTSLRQRRLEEGRRLRLHRSFQSGGGNAVARRTVGVGRNDIEQVRGNTGIGQVRGDAGAHGARAQNGDFLNPFLSWDVSNDSSV